MRCPRAAKYKYVDKMKEAPSAAMERGTRIHKLAEDYLNRSIGQLPVELSKLPCEFKKLRGQPVKYIEQGWAWKKGWSETDWKDWSGAWVRVKIDAMYINEQYNAAVVIDHKTGKFRESDKAKYDAQLELSCLAALKKFPTVEVATPRNWYIDEGVVYPDPEVLEVEFFRKDVPRLEEKWNELVKPMLTDTEWEPTPSESACQFCSFSKLKGGPCKY